LERLEECAPVATQQFLPAVRVCYGVDKRNQPDAFGTCFLMEIEGRSFLVTAAHVIDENARTTIYIAGEKDLVMLEATFLATGKPLGDRNKDHFDFAFTELTDAQCRSLGGGAAIREDMFALNRSPPDRRAYMTLGFPASMQEVAWGKPVVRTNPWTYVGFHKDDAQLAQKLGVNGDNHFFLPYDKRVKVFSGAVQDAIKPKGASGGLLVDLGPMDPALMRPDTPCKARVAGLLIEHHKDKKSIVAVKIQLVLDEIRKYLRDTPFRPGSAPAS
jgi:hypothetical protein